MSLDYKDGKEPLHERQDQRKRSKGKRLVVVVDVAEKGCFLLLPVGESNGLFEGLSSAKTMAERGPLGVRIQQLRARKCARHTVCQSTVPMSNSCDLCIEKVRKHEHRTTKKNKRSSCLVTWSIRSRSECLIKPTQPRVNHFQQQQLSPTINSP